MILKKLDTCVLFHYWESIFHPMSLKMTAKLEWLGFAIIKNSLLVFWIKKVLSNRALFFLVSPKRLSFLIIRSIHQCQCVHEIFIRTDNNMLAHNERALNNSCVEILIPSWVTPTANGCTNKWLMIHCIKNQHLYLNPKLGHSRY